MINDQEEGPVRQELIRVLENSEKHVKVLEDHIDFGHKLVDTRETKLFAMQKKLGQKQDQPRRFANVKIPETI